VTRCAIVLGRECLSEADLRLFCAVLRTLAFLEADEANHGLLDSMLSGATLSGLHVFSLSFYKRLINYDGRESGECFLDLCLKVCFTGTSTLFNVFYAAGILSNAPRYIFPIDCACLCLATILLSATRCA
jgi:hypothetical protein